MIILLGRSFDDYPREEVVTIQSIHVSKEYWQCSSWSFIFQTKNNNLIVAINRYKDVEDFERKDWNLT